MSATSKLNNTFFYTILHNSHCTLHITHRTLHISHFTFHIAHCTMHIHITVCLNCLYLSVCIYLFVFICLYLCQVKCAIHIIYKTYILNCTYICVIYLFISNLHVHFKLYIYLCYLSVYLQSTCTS